MKVWRETSRKRWIARWAIAGLLCQIVLAAWHTPLMALALGANDGPLSPTVIICTGSGVRQITFDQNGNPVEMPELPNYGKACQICMALTSVELMPLDVASETPAVTKWTGTRYPLLRYILTDRRPHVRCGLDPPVTG
jgi:hypothetical protein